ncbi:Cardiolipin synthase A [Candidatus Providencia siddallii]|uniref:Cardiolipin synthase A n=1 Tax=Candidatus Providencia siddallii TaxID=1715285 RepID=A0A0M6W7M2_9GAMM|nr:Cardiolipin synthase A [Candidatus Providencia siddallii]
MAKAYVFISWIFFFFYWLFITGITIRVLIKKKPVTSAMVWLLVIYIIPLIGVIAYIAFGELHLGKRRIKKIYNMSPSVLMWLENLRNFKHIFATKNSQVAQPLFQLCEKRQGIAGVKGNQIKLLTTCKDSFESLLKDINNAKISIEMVFYIWQPGGLVNNVIDASINAAKRGVKCRIMVDSAGSWYFFRGKYPDKMRAAGIEFVESLKINLMRFFLRRMDLRQHRKIVIIDNYISYTGSMNMIDTNNLKYNSNIGELIDILVRMEGPVSTTLGIVYAFDWEMETGNCVLPPTYDVNIMPLKHNNNHIAQIIASGPGFPNQLIQQSLMTAIFSARKKLVMTTPYFVPSDVLLHAICTVAMRGVDVSIIIPRKNDSFLVRWASRAFYSELLEAGVKIYHFENGLLHTKSVLVDDELSLIGSVNLDMRSLWLNFEITIVIDDKNFGNDLTLIQCDYMLRSTQLDIIDWNKRSFWHRVIERFCYFFSPLL